MVKLECTYAILKIYQMFFLLLFLSHWTACLYALIPSFMLGDTWMTAFAAKELAAGQTASGFDLYCGALYWAIMTITSIGYGDIVPVNTPERILTSVYMLAVAIIWAYVIGTFAAIASTLDPNGARSPLSQPN